MSLRPSIESIRPTGALPISLPISLSLSLLTHSMTDSGIALTNKRVTISGKSDQLRLNTTMMSLGYEYKFKAPPYYTTLVRALAPLEGYGLTADPSFNILETSLPFIVRQICLDTTGTQEMRALSETLRKESLLRPNFKQQGVLFYVRIVFYVFLSFLSRLWRRLMAAIGSKWGSVGEHVGEE